MINTRPDDIPNPQQPTEADGTNQEGADRQELASSYVPTGLPTEGSYDDDGDGGQTRRVALALVRAPPGDGASPFPTIRAPFPRHFLTICASF